MVVSSRRQILTGVRMVGALTLASRVLGMLRDIAMAALFGLAGGGVMDALAIAIWVPNFFRRLFGEGTLAASYLPVLTETLQRDRQTAWKLASVSFVWLAVSLAILVLAGQALCAAVMVFGNPGPRGSLAAGLMATLLPYMVLVCLTAHMAATLHALSHFTAPALAPVVLNVLWLGAIAFVAPVFSPDKRAQAYALAACIVAAGFVQLAAQVPPLRRRGFRFDYDWHGGREAFLRVTRRLHAMLFGLTVTQLNTLADVLLAWGFSAPRGTNVWLPWRDTPLAYPMELGAPAAVYYGERLYQFPVGILGIAVATVVFPALSRHAARGDSRRIARDLSLGLRLVLFLSVPASVGLLLLAEPLARLLFEHGAFTPRDTARTARMISGYAVGVWAFCALPMLIRGFYAVGDWRTPVRVGMAIVGMNLLLSGLLMWPMAASGLAVSTSLAAAAHAVILAWMFSRRTARLPWRGLSRTLRHTAIATAAMSAVCYASQQVAPRHPGLVGDLWRVLLPVAAAVLAYWVVYRALGGREGYLWAGLYRGRRR